MPTDEPSDPKSASEPREDDREPTLEDILEDDTASGGRANRVLRFAKRLMDRRELAEDTRDLLWTVVATSDKAKTEAVKMVAREARTYLSELKLKEDLMHLATSYSLEISLHLKPLAEAVGPVPEAPEADPDEDEDV